MTYRPNDLESTGLTFGRGRSRASPGRVARSRIVGGGRSRFGPSARVFAPTPEPGRSARDAPGPHRLGSAEESARYEDPASYSAGALVPRGGSMGPSPSGDAPLAAAQTTESPGHESTRAIRRHGEGSASARWGCAALSRPHRLASGRGVGRERRTRGRPAPKSRPARRASAQLSVQPCYSTSRARIPLPIPRPRTTTRHPIVRVENRTPVQREAAATYAIGKPDLEALEFSYPLVDPLAPGPRQTIPILPTGDPIRR